MAEENEQGSGGWEARVAVGARDVRTPHPPAEREAHAGGDFFDDDDDPPAESGVFDVRRGEAAKQIFALAERMRRATAALGERPGQSADIVLLRPLREARPRPLPQRVKRGRV